jgi:polyhydroxyalkanoate synthesis regulator phasin
MSKTLRNILLIGLGLTTITKDKIEELVRMIVAEGELKEPEARELINKVTAKVEGKIADAKKAVNKEINNLARKIDKATRPARAKKKD